MMIKIAISPEKIYNAFKKRRKIESGLKDLMGGTYVRNPKPEHKPIHKLYTQLSGKTDNQYFNLRAIIKKNKNPEKYKLHLKEMNKGYYDL